MSEQGQQLRKKRAPVVLGAQRQQGQLKVLFPHLSLFHGHSYSPGRSFSSVAFLSNEGKLVLFLFYLHAWLWKLYQSKSWFRKQITHALRKNGSNPITSISGHKVSSRDLPKSLQTHASPVKINPNTFLVNPSWINSCLSLLPLFEKCVQAYFNIFRYAHHSKLFSNWFAEHYPRACEFCNKAVVIWTFLAE